jgi:hypothetical protein
MASVNGEYVGPLELEDAARIVEDVEAGRPVLEHKQLRFRACADTGAASASLSDRTGKQAEASASTEEASQEAAQTIHDTAAQEEPPGSEASDE